MRGSWKLARIAGIDVSIHWSFLLLLGFVVLTSLGRGIGLVAVVGEVSFVVAVFFCVVLHEYGHALAARHFGIETHGITLLPIGGVAQLESIPRKPKQELVIALAGPAVNLAIAVLLLPVVIAGRGLLELTGVSLFSGQFWGRLFAFNLVMIVFNMLPAFPMDGGRVLRAMLALVTPYVKATELAVGVGKMMAVGFAVVGLVSNPFLILIGVFVFFAGQSELAMLRDELRQAQWVRPAQCVPTVTIPAGTEMRPIVIQMGPNRRLVFLGVQDAL